MLHTSGFIRRTRHAFTKLVHATLVTLLSSSIALAQQARTGPTDAAELEAFIDGLMAAHLEELHIAGATVAVVKNGEVFFTKGYGYSDIETRAPVDPETTLFRIGSVSKLFTWTTVMQLVEEGKLDLNTDINEYLRDFQIPNTYPEPVTLEHILTHSAGFEDWVVGLFGDGEEDIRTLSEILSEQIPARVRPPGEAASYSNHATGMAAHIVEIASGMPWGEVVMQRVLEPLGMRYATFDQPVPDHLVEHLSKGYSYANNKFTEEEFEWVPLAPVGAAAASATDMARFMIAHLQLGRYGDERILGEETATLMHSELYRMAPGVNPMAHGFMDLSANGERIIGHGGDTFWFHTNLVLLPEHDFGVFVSYNTTAGGRARDAFVEALLDRYFPVPDPERVTPPEDFAERADRFTGQYRMNRFSHQSLAKLAVVAPIVVSSTDEGTLGFMDNEWVEVSPLTFRDVDGESTIVFREDEDGKITHAFLASLPIIALERVPAGERKGLHMFILILAITMIAGTILSWPAGWGARRWYGVKPSIVRLPKGERLVLGVAAILLLIFILGMSAVLSGNPEQIAIEIPTTMRFLLALPLLAVGLTLGAAYFAVQQWRHGSGRTLSRLAYSASALSFTLFIWQLSVWNLLGWQF